MAPKASRQRPGVGSTRLRSAGSSRNAVGRLVKPVRTLLGPKAIEARSVAMREEHQARMSAMTAEETSALERLRELPVASNDGQDYDYEDLTLNDVLDGSIPLDISHAGGEYEELTRAIVISLSRSKVHRVDYRTRRDRRTHIEYAYTAQMDAMADAYLSWSLEMSVCDDEGHFKPESDASVPTDSGSIHLKVVDVFAVHNVNLVILPTDRNIASALVRQGVMPCSPIAPQAAIALNCLELYRVAQLRNPHLSIQSWTKTLCDLQTKDFRETLSRQLSNAFDAYLQMRQVVHQRVQSTLGRDEPDWRLKHACPACTYKLKDENPLLFSMLYTMDGNDSLKRVLKRTHLDDESEGVGPSSELPSSRKVPGDRYLSREDVNKWSKGVLQEMLGEMDADDPDYNPCVNRWKNMKDDLTSRMWAIFDETGIFLALCRHGFSLIIADMVQSGELAKYPLAVVDKLLAAFGEGLGGGYDIGCKFKTTLGNSVLGDRARSLHHTCLVGAFHGHAHCRLCQLWHLATYVKGLGLEDLEGCERAFSKSNALAGAIRHASIFHRRQSILAYFEHNDTFEIYRNLTTFLLNNYKQALKILDESPTLLEGAMRELSVTDTNIFEDWLAEEKTYLLGLQKEPEVETLQMEYWQKLVNLTASELALAAAVNVWSISTPSTGIPSGRSLETARRHAIENHENDLKAVQALERKLEITSRWLPQSSEWQTAGRLVAMRKYQRALDVLEGLIVARMFELTKMNRSQTGYALRKHIGKALTARSPAIRTALERYNTAAKALNPPRPTLEWAQVVEYAFLADFDLLRDARQDISQRPWATPTGRLAMDTYFKMRRAKEEIQRLDVEVARMATYLCDERRYLRSCEDQVRTFNPALAHQIYIHRMERDRFTQYHTSRLIEIAKLPGFSGSIAPGEALDTSRGSSASTPAIPPPETRNLESDGELMDIELRTTDAQEGAQEDADSDEEEEEISRALHDIFIASSRE